MGRYGRRRDARRLHGERQTLGRAAAKRPEAEHAVPPRRLAARAIERGLNPELLLDVDDDVILFDGDGVGLRDIRALEQGIAAFDRHGEFPEADIVAIAPGLSRADIVLPAMPGAADHRAVRDDVVLAGLIGFDAMHDLAAAERCALMWAFAQERVEAAGDVEDSDFPIGDVDELAGAGRDLVRLRDDVTPPHVTSARK